MKILHLLASPVFSGPAENVFWLALAQRELGHEVHIAVDRKRAGSTSEEPVLPRLREHGLDDGGGLELSVKSTPWALVEDLRRLRARSEDVLHAHFSHDHFLARWAGNRRARLIRSVHAPRSLRRTLPRGDAYTVFRAEDVALLPSKPHRVLPALVDPRFRPANDTKAVRKALGLEGEPLIGMVSTFQSSRRHALALDAFARLRAQRPNARLILVGDGQLEGTLRSRVRELGLESGVTFAGYQARESFVAHLQAFDEVWVLGLGNDWSARAAAQARACGARVVGVAEGALPLLCDAVVEPCVEALVAASLAGGRRTHPLASNVAIAKSIVELYEEAMGLR